MSKVLLEQHRHPQQKRLILQLRSNSRFWQARAWVNGKWSSHSTKTTQLTTAFRLGGEWFARLMRTADDRPYDRAGSDPTIGELSSSYRSQLAPNAKIYAGWRWGPIATFWRTLPVSGVTTATFKDFLKWRRRIKTRFDTTVKPHTLHKDLILLRQILKYAREEAHIKELPIIPKVGKIDPNVRPWLTRAEWEHLMRVSMQRVVEAEGNPRVHQQRDELDDQIIFAVATMCRVGEMLALRFRDCKVKKNSDGEEILFCEVKGKRGIRSMVGRSKAAMVYKRRLRAAGDDQSQLIFPTHHRDAFRELLKAADLHIDPISGFERNFKSLRATAISLRILESPEPNLLLIARNAGTSVHMIDKFYAQRLSAEMGSDLLTARRKR